MAKETLLLTLAKVIIAAAWADGEIQTEEVNSLKDLLFHLPDITGREWAMLEMYLESPIGPDERSRLVLQLQDSLRSRKDKQMALTAIQDLIAADGVVTEQEKQIAAEIEAMIEAAPTGLFKQIGASLFGPIQRQTEAASAVTDREAHFEDFIKNRVYYGLQIRKGESEVDLNLPEARLRKLSLAGGLMARVAHADREISDEEFQAFSRILQDGWGLDAAEAEFVTEVALTDISIEMDYFRLSRQFFEQTGEKERLKFLDVLFAIAAADGLATSEEIEEIRNLARALKLTHQDFISAKLKLPRGKRAN